MARTQAGILLIELLMSVPMYDESHEKSDRREQHFVCMCVLAMFQAKNAHAHPMAKNALLKLVLGCEIAGYYIMTA
jgi:hypothetical protein